VTSRKGAQDQPNEVVLGRGQPAQPTWFFSIDHADYLQRLDRGEVTFGTLAGKAKQSDKVAMDADFMPGFTPDARTPGSDFYQTFTRVSFHFWYRGNPEIVPFGTQALRNIHGADSTALYYQPGLRTIWFSIKKGQHANRGSGEGVGPWSKLLIFVNGAGKARIGERTIDVKEGDRLFVPPGAVNQFWNDSPTALEGVLIIFGEGA
jgi:mannose-6-phosphate isomerase-like protein (cupin superfamily)